MLASPSLPLIRRLDPVVRSAPTPLPLPPFLPLFAPLVSFVARRAKNGLRPTSPQPTALPLSNAPRPAHLFEAAMRQPRNHGPAQRFPTSPSAAPGGRDALCASVDSFVPAPPAAPPLSPFSKAPASPPRLSPPPFASFCAFLRPTSSHQLPSHFPLTLAPPAAP